MEFWRFVWRGGFQPLIQTKSLEGLLAALEGDIPTLIQGETTIPPLLMCVQDYPCEAACGIGYCGVIENGGIGVATLGQVEEYFGRLCFEADQRLNNSAAYRWFLNWFDDTPREKMRRELIQEIKRGLNNRSTLV